MELQVCARCFWTIDRKLNIDGIKLLNKKLTCPAVSSHSTDSGQVVIHAVTQRERLPTSTMLNISHAAKKINHENSSQWKIV